MEGKARRHGCSMVKDPAQVLNETTVNDVYKKESSESPPSKLRVVTPTWPMDLTKHSVIISACLVRWLN